MILGMAMLIISMIYLLLTGIVYYSKKRLKNNENRIYSCLIMTNFLGLILELSCIIIGSMSNKFIILNEFVNRCFLLYILTWILLFTKYIFTISFNNHKKLSVFINKNIKMVNKIFFIVFVFFGLGLIFFPLSYYYDGHYVYSYGLATQFLYFINFVLISLWIVCLIINYKEVGYKKYIPLFTFIFGAILNLVIREINPGILLITVTQTFITIMMYYTIENPDLKILDELYRNRKLIESSNQDFSNFLFKVTQEIRNPIKQIVKISANNNLKEINVLGRQLEYLVDDALDISTMTTQNLKIYNSKYNPKHLFNQIKIKVQDELINQNKIRFSYKLGMNIPHYVYGDYIKLKQVLFSILENSIKYTHKGYIDFEVSTIIKYDICRIIINISDSGEGISIDIINDILSLKDTSHNINLEKTTLNLKDSKLLLNKLGGSFMIKSIEGQGSTVSITIDQKIVPTNETEFAKKIDIYEEIVNGNKKVIIVDDDIDELAVISDFFESNGILVTSSLFGKDVMDKIANKHHFDLIVLDDETNTYSALSVLQVIKENSKFNTPVVVMLNDNKECIKLQYMKDGFADVIMKSKLKDELKRIIKRFL